MSEFKVLIKTIGEVNEHPNADRLMIIKLYGIEYQMIAQKGQFQVGDKVVYFPLDSIIPQVVLSLIGFEGMLSGSEKNRVKTVKLRGQLSQGILADPESLEPIMQQILLLPIDTDLTETLNIKKYNPEPISSRAGNLIPLPSSIKKYDIENAERYPTIIEKFMDMNVNITEKLEGSNYALFWDKETDTTIVCQRRFQIQEIEDGGEHTWIRATKNSGLYKKIETLRTIIAGLSMVDPNTIAIRGEVVGSGIQKNIYKLTDVEVFAFDIEINSLPLDTNTFRMVCTLCQIKTVPYLATDVLLSEWLNGETIVNKSTGASVLNEKVLREGIVIKPSEEFTDAKIGRAFLKQKSPEYLLKSKL